MDWRLPAPSITGTAITSDPSDDHTYGLGDVVKFEATSNTAVTVSGTPELQIMMDPNWGRNWRTDYASGSGTTKLVFTHTVVSPNWSPTGVAIVANGVKVDSETGPESGGTLRGGPRSPAPAWDTTRGTR